MPRIVSVVVGFIGGNTGESFVRTVSSNVAMTDTVTPATGAALFPATSLYPATNLYPQG